MILCFFKSWPLLSNLRRTEEANMAMGQKENPYKSQVLGRGSFNQEVFFWLPHIFDPL